MAKYDYNNRNWEEELAEARRKQQEAEQNLSQIGSFNYNRQADYDNALNNLINRKQFSYDMDKDALYKAYKNQYANLGKLAMQDTMGQASAMTGGYGNSYALTAGQQMYNQYLQKANDMLPSLYGMALDRYNAEGTNLSNNLNALQNDRSNQYSTWQDAYNRAMADRDYAGNQYNNIYNSAYEAARAAVADEQWERQFALSQAKASGSGGGRRSSGSSKGNQGGTVKEWDKLSKSVRSKATEAFSAGGIDGFNKYLNELADAGWSDEQIYEIYSHFITDENKLPSDTKKNYTGRSFTRTDGKTVRLTK